MTSMINAIVAFGVGVGASIVGALLFQFGMDRLNLRFTFRRILRDVHKLQDRMQDDDFTPERIVTIDRNGTIVGSILAGLTGVSGVHAIATSTRRLPSGERITIVPNEHLPRPEAIEGKNILVVICFNDTGTSLEIVYKALSSQPFAPADIRLAALYTSVSPKLKPKYYAWEVDRDLNTSISHIIYKMPWMSRRWRHILASERLPRTR